MSNDSDLIKLAKKHGTDKWSSHYYAQHYERHLSLFKDKDINLLEIGVGGYSDPLKGGESLRMWKEYFSKGLITAIDIHDKSKLSEDRIDIYQGSQIDDVFLQRVVDEVGGFDVIVDDGSHINSDIISTFKFLFKHLKDGGIYVVEDLQTSYWRKDGGDSFNLKNKKTAMNYFKSLTDCLNYEEIDNPYYKISYFDKKIVAIHFYHNMVFIQKGENSEGSNIVKNNVKPTRHMKREKLRYLYRMVVNIFLIRLK